MRMRPTHAVLGALTVMMGSAIALAAGQADAQSAIQISVSSRHLAFGQDLRVSGNATSQSAGKTIVLEFARAGSGHWRAVQSTRAGSRGGFRFKTRLRQSGLVRAVEPTSASASTSASTSSGGSSVSSADPGSTAASSARAVAVASEFRLRSHSMKLLQGQTITVSGRLLPEVGRRKVRLFGRSGGGWHWLTSTRTGRHGGFRLRYRAGQLGSQQVRAFFHGDRLNTHTSRWVGQLTVFRQSLASWYADGGATACGFHATMGVANRSLPCGTKVTFRYGGHQVTAVVDDRGPYVGGREWDLNQNTAGALGFAGVGPVWATR
jgi:hypothetical protein